MSRGVDPELLLSFAGSLMFMPALLSATESSSSSSSSITYAPMLFPLVPGCRAKRDFVSPCFVFILLRSRAFYCSDRCLPSASSSSFSMLAISTTISSGSPLLLARSLWITEWRKERAPPKSVSTTKFSKSITFLADYLANRCFLAIKIILRVCQMHHMTISPSSPASSKPLIAPDLEKRDKANTALQKVTTRASKMFHQRILLLAGSRTYFWQPTSLIRHIKSIPISRLRMNSSTMNNGVSATLNPSKMVTMTRPKLRISKPK